MEHVTALVDHDATTHACWQGGCPCSCAKLVAAGWKVECFACGRGLDRPLGDVLAETVEATPEWVVEAEDRRLHTAARVRAAIGEGWVLDTDVDQAEGDWSSIEDYDRWRDDRLVDEAEGRVA